MFAMITYQHGCGKSFSVLVDSMSFDIGIDLQQENQPLSEETKKIYSQMAQAKGSILVNPKETPMIVCDCGGWIDIEEVIQEHKRGNLK